jgi:hypothetical protein
VCLSFLLEAEPQAPLAAQAAGSRGIFEVGWPQASGEADVTERDWLNSKDSQEMLNFVEDIGHWSERKLRLFGCACCRRVWHLLTDSKWRKAVEVVEKYADGLIAERDFFSWGWLRERPGGVVALEYAMDAAETTAQYAAGVVAEKAAAADGPRAVGWDKAFRRAWTRWHDYAVAIVEADAAFPEFAAWVAGREADRNAEQAAQAALVRCIFGPVLFRPLPPVAPAVLAWNGGVVGRLAAGSYDERDFQQGRLGVLADAAEEAGLTEAELLGHLRGPGPHARGCWAVDLLLGRE